MDDEIKISHVTAHAVDSITLSKIHMESDPKSIWGQIGLKYCERLLYKSLIREPNASIVLAQCGSKVIGFIAITKFDASGKSELSFQIETWFVKLRVLFKVLRSQILAGRFFAFVLSRVQSIKSVKQSDYEIVAMMVLPEFQSKGVGSALIKFLSFKFKESAICVFTNGDRSKNFYEKNHFQLISTSHFAGHEVSCLILSV